MEKNITRNFDNQNLVPENSFDSIKITLASPEKIKSWTYISKNTNLKHAFKGRYHF